MSDLEKVARAILTERLGAEAAGRCEEGDSLAWRDALRYSRAAIAAMEHEAADRISLLMDALKPFAETAEYADAMELDDDDYVECAPFKASDYRKARTVLGAWDIKE